LLAGRMTKFQPPAADTAGVFSFCARRSTSDRAQPREAGVGELAGLVRWGLGWRRRRGLLKTKESLSVEANGPGRRELRSPPCCCRVLLGRIACQMKWAALPSRAAGLRRGPVGQPAIQQCRASRLLLEALARLEFVGPQVSQTCPQNGGAARDPAPDWSADEALIIALRRRR